MSESIATTVWNMALAAASKGGFVMKPSANRRGIAVVQQALDEARNAALAELRNPAILERAARAMFCFDERWPNESLDNPSVNYWFRCDEQSTGEDADCKQHCDEYRQEAAQVLDAVIRSLSTQDTPDMPATNKGKGSHDPCDRARHRPRP